MIITKNVTANNTPKEISATNQSVSHYTIVITNTSSNKHALIGNSNVSTTNYGIRVEHDSPPIVLENMYYKDSLYAISEDPTATVPLAIMIIERK